MAHAAANLSRLELARNVSLFHTVLLPVKDICLLSAEELLLAYSDAGLRAVSLRTGLLAAKKLTAIQNVYRVAFDTHTDTLLLVVETPTYVNQLVSLRRNASEWLEVQRINISTPARYIHIPFISVCDSRVLLGNGGKTLYVFDVNEEHNLSAAGHVTLESAFRWVACTRRGNDTLVAFAHESSVSLQRLAALPLRLERLANVNVNVTNPKPFFFRDLLLVVEYSVFSKTYAIESFRVTDNALIERRVLLDAQAAVGIRGWALAGEQLVIMTPNEFLVYEFSSNGE